MTRPFGIVLAGGGARGFAHVSVLRALEHDGLVPSVVVGVSMGAVVGVTYATRDDWYDALLSVDIAESSRAGSEGRPETRCEHTRERPELDGRRHTARDRRCRPLRRLRSSRLGHPSPSTYECLQPITNGSLDLGSIDRVDRKHGHFDAHTLLISLDDPHGRHTLGGGPGREQCAIRQFLYQSSRV